MVRADTVSVPTAGSPQFERSNIERHRRNLRLLIVLAATASAFFIGIVVKTWLIGGP